MSRFEIAYDSEEDVLEVTFETFDEHFARTISFSENIVVYTDLMLSTVWGLTIYGYVESLEEGEFELDALKQANAGDRVKLVSLITRQPLSLFIEPPLEGSSGIRLKTPNLGELIFG